MSDNNYAVEQSIWNDLILKYVFSDQIVADKISLLYNTEHGQRELLISGLAQAKEQFLSIDDLHNIEIELQDKVLKDEMSSIRQLIHYIIENQKELDSQFK